MSKDTLQDGYIWCLGMLHELEERGFVSCDEGDKLSPKGIGEFDQLKATGWAPPKDMALAVLTDLTGSTDAAAAIWTAITIIREQERKKRTDDEGATNE